MKSELIESINKGLNALSEQQQPNGSFLSLSSPNLKSFSSSLIFPSTFSTSLILNCLNSLPQTPQTNKIRTNCSTFLNNQKSDHWSFNYWDRNSKEFKKLPYPDDLDDTFCAAAALFNFQPDLIDGTALAKLVNILTATESQTGGPYRTWLVAKTTDEVWLDVDLAVNINIAYFLSLQQINLPKLDHYLYNKIASNQISSPYYPQNYPLIYFLSRFYQGKYVNKLKEILLFQQNKQGYWESPLNTALSISSLLNLGVEPIELTPAIKYLLGKQKKSIWPAHLFYRGVNPKKGKKYYAGSTALTTAFCLEALNKYLQTLKKANVNKVIVKDTSSSDKIYKKVLAETNNRLANLSPEFKTDISKTLKNFIKPSLKKQVVLLPLLFKSHLKNKHTPIPDELLIKLGQASLLGWLAYTIYDDFLDQEGQPIKLSLANLALRQMTTIFNEVLPTTSFKVTFHKILDQLDEANFWEISHCRLKIINNKIDLNHYSPPQFGDLSQLAHRSLGHALTPLAILYFLKLKSPVEEKNLLQFFKHFLIAKQLNDDAHDWEEDLRLGRLNFVNSLLLSHYQKNKSPKTVDLDELIPKLQKIFWYQKITKVNNLILKHTQKARKLLQKSSIISPSFADKLLANCEAAAQKGLKDQTEALKFLNSYQP